MPSTAQYVMALHQLEQDGMRRKWKPLWLAHLNAPPHTITMPRLAKSVGYATIMRQIFSMVFLALAFDNCLVANEACGPVH